MFFSASIIIITSVLWSLRLSMTAAAVPLTSESFILPAQLQQQPNNATQSPNTTGLNAFQSSNAIPIVNSTYVCDCFPPVLHCLPTNSFPPRNSDSPSNWFYRYPIPGTRYILFVLECNSPLPPTALKATFTKGISELESKIDAGSGSIAPDSFSAYQKPILVEWYSEPLEYKCPYDDLLHLWKALRLVLLDRSRRFPAWLYAKQCLNKVNVAENPGEPDAVEEFTRNVGGFLIKIVEGPGGGGGLTGGSGTG